MKKAQRVIIVDDDPYCHMICKSIMRRAASNVEFLEFISPEEGIEYIESVYGKSTDDCPTALLLDINMPVMTGWDFLERYEKAGSNSKNQFVNYLLSSSIGQRDVERAAENKYIKSFLTKPFRKEMTDVIFENVYS